MPDGKASLYPQVLSEAAASLLPDGPRPAVVFHVRVGPDGQSKLDGAERSLILNRAKLAYETVRPADLPDDFPELSRRIAFAEAARGASRIEPLEQEVHATKGGGYDISFRPRLQSEDDNAAMSLATNLAIADALYAAGIGLFRVMPEPDERTVQRLRYTARAFGIEWPADMRPSGVRAVVEQQAIQSTARCSWPFVVRVGEPPTFRFGSGASMARRRGSDLHTRHRTAASPRRPLCRDGRPRSSQRSACARSDLSGVPQTS